MMGGAEVKWREDGQDETWLLRDSPGKGRQEVTTRPEYAWKLFGTNFHTGNEELEALKVSCKWNLETITDWLLPRYRNQ